MQRHTLRDRIVTGSFTLPVMAVLTLLIWVIPNPEDGVRWVGLGVTLLTAYAIMELNNRNSLLRIRSRLMSTTYLMLMAICPMLHGWSEEMIPGLCLIMSYGVLFASYQQVRPQGYAFHAFLLISLGSLFFPPLLLCGVAYFISMIFQLRTFTWRSFTAALLGTAVPYWGYAAYAIWQNHLDTAFLYLTDWFHPTLPDYSRLPLPMLVTCGTVLLFSLLAFVHFFHTAYNDKIRTRMYFYVITTQEVLLAAGMLLLPDHATQTLRLLIINSSLLIAHYYALGRGRFFGGWFNVSLLLLIALGVYNLLFPIG